MQKQKALLVVGASLFTIILIMALRLSTKSQDNVHESGSGRPSAVKSTQAKSLSPKGGDDAKKLEEAGLPAANPEEIAAAKGKILEEIQDAAVSYDAAELPKIEPYLLHPDQEIRQAAMNGMIALGDQAAGPMLRKAAALAPTPQEVVALSEAADYVELPSGKFHLRSK